MAALGYTIKQVVVWVIIGKEVGFYFSFLHENIDQASGPKLV